MTLLCLLKVEKRVMKGLQRYIGDSLRLKVNTQKSTIDRPWKRTFLGFTFSQRDLRIKVADKSLLKLKATVKLLSRRTRGHSFKHIIAELRKFLLGWAGFCSCKTCVSTIHSGQSDFDIAEVLSPLRDVGKWIRRR